jgi:hypothetical protein
MNLKEFISKLLSQPKSNEAQSGGQPPSARSQEVFKNMLRKIGQTQEIELTCGETFDLLDQYAEMVMNGEALIKVLQNTAAL